MRQTAETSKKKSADVGFYLPAAKYAESKAHGG
jgi:hypothetical protein